MGIVVRLFINTLAVLTGSYILKGVRVDGVMTALIVAVVLGVLNTFLKPLLILLTLPITVLTFGLFIFIINALIILLASHLVSGFTVENFWWALLYSLVVSIVNSFLSSLV